MSIKSKHSSVPDITWYKLGKENHGMASRGIHMLTHEYIRCKKGSGKIIEPKTK